MSGSVPPPADDGRYPCGDLGAYGISASLYNEGGFVVFGHGRRALAAANAIGRQEDGHGWRIPYREYNPTVRQVWACFHETCGCTEEEHAAGHPVEGDEDVWPECDCEFPGLPPCDEEFSFVTETSDTEKPGWLPIVEVKW